MHEATGKNAPVFKRRRVARPTRRPITYGRRAPAVRPSFLVHSDDPKIATDANGNPVRRKLALLLPGHNEELIIATTIRSAVAAGQSMEDIYVVDDASDDKTRQLAVELLGKQNVLTVKRSGKALAVKKAIRKFHIQDRYQWIHVADADSIFSPDYFRIYRKKLNDKYVVALGFVQSLRGNWISTYRSFSYTYGQHFYRRIQAALGMISVFPGPVTSFRTDILPELELTGNSLTEDFDVTLQVHRKRLGKMIFIPNAINYTQDPPTFRDFRKQSMRWYRGFFQGIKAYRIGLRRQRIDIGIGFQLLQTLVFALQILVLLPFVLITTHQWIVLPTAICIDFLFTGGIVILAAIAARRWNMLGVLPFYYILRAAEVIMYFTAFVEVILLKRFTRPTIGWDTGGNRRYKLDSTALKDVA